MMPAPATAPPAGSPPGTPPVSYVLLAPDGNSPPIKLTTTDSQKIQESAGLPVEQLEDNDLKEEMQDLNIKSQPLTQQDYAALGMQPPAAAGTTVVHHSAPPSPTPSAPTNPTASLEQQLKSLDNLKTSGLITEDDYNAKKKQILGI